MSKIQTAKKQIGKKLKSARQHNKVSKYRIMKDLAINSAQLNSIESGEKQSTLDSVLKVACYLDCHEGLL
jgi:transcriptional regulator with XRE-family HTH domain